MTTDLTVAYLAEYTHHRSNTRQVWLCQQLCLIQPSHHCAYIQHRFPLLQQPPHVGWGTNSPIGIFTPKTAFSSRWKAFWVVSATNWKWSTITQTPSKLSKRLWFICHRTVRWTSWRVAAFHSKLISEGKRRSFGNNHGLIIQFTSYHLVSVS